MESELMMSIHSHDNDVGRTSYLDQICPMTSKWNDCDLLSQICHDWLTTSWWCKYQTILHPWSKILGLRQCQSRYQTSIQELCWRHHDVSIFHGSDSEADNHDRQDNQWIPLHHKCSHWCAYQHATQVSCNELSTTNFSRHVQTHFRAHFLLSSRGI